jgi:hypothetical protein
VILKSNKILKHTNTNLVYVKNKNKLKKSPIYFKYTWQEYENYDSWNPFFFIKDHLPSLSKLRFSYCITLIFESNKKKKQKGRLD